MSSDTDTDDDIFIATTINSLETYRELHLVKEPCQTSKLTGTEFVWELMTGHGGRCFELLRMQRSIFLRFCFVLQERSLLSDSRRMSSTEQLAIFLFTLGHNERNRVMHERFQHSGETISRVFHKVLNAMVTYSMEIIKPTMSYLEIPPEIQSNRKYRQIFKNCIGAIDGTHIDAVVPIDKQVPYRGRKGTCTQNILAACSFDMRFTYVNAGWEGSANDLRILLETIRTPWLNFHHAPPGKYYIVDAGYPNMTGFLAPYRGIRYHLQDFRRENARRTAKEKFNYIHSSLRNVIERCFGVLKARFPILKQIPPYSLTIQRDIVVATMTIHNFIKQEAVNDELFCEYEDDAWVNEEADEENGANMGDIILQHEDEEMGAYRDRLAQACDEVYD